MCNSPDKGNTWCSKVVGAIGTRESNGGGALTQSCQWRVPGLAAGGKAQVEKCVADTKQFKSFDACIESIGLQP